MTGTDLCVNKSRFVPVIFEPPCNYGPDRHIEFVPNFKTTRINLKFWCLLLTYFVFLEENSRMGLRDAECWWVH